MSSRFRFTPRFLREQNVVQNLDLAQNFPNKFFFHFFMGKNVRAMRGNAMGWYYHHKWDGIGMGWDGSRNFVPITSYHPITITVICTTHQLPVGGMSAYTIPSIFPSHHPELLPIPSTTHLSNFQPSHHIPIFSHPDTTAQQSFSWIFPGRQAPYPP